MSDFSGKLGMKIESNDFFFNVFIASSSKKLSSKSLIDYSCERGGFNLFEGVSIVELCLSY